MNRDPNLLGIRPSGTTALGFEPSELERLPQHAALRGRAGAVRAADSGGARLRSGRRASLGAPVSTGRILSFALCAGGALFLSACAGDPSCEESRTCASAAVGTGGKTPTDAGTGGRSGSSTGGASGTTGTGGSTGGGGAGGNGGSEGGGGAAGADAGDASDGGQEAEAGPTCSGTIGMREDGCPIVDPGGIFVSAAGSASGADGSRTHPFTSISRAISAAMAAGDGGSGGGSPDGGSSALTHIYVCADGGDYAETIILDASKNALSDGFAVLGGFRCADWKYDPTKRTKLASSLPNVWIVSGLVKGLTVEDFEISAADMTASTASSIAMVVNKSSKNVVLRRVTITAGKGSDGARGSDGDNGVDGIGAEAQQAGLPALCSGSLTGQYGGYWVGTSSNPSPGGAGGTGYRNAVGVRGNYGGPQTNVTPPNVDNGGAGATTLGSNGTKGGDGSKGNDGAAAARFSMSDGFGPTGYTAGIGAEGVDGYTGQGGGGGGSSTGTTTCIGASGGAGGCGGLGGKHGTGGRSGGVSVALYVWDSAVTLENVTLVSGDGGTGGDGGNGGLGGKGQTGGPSGTGNSANNIGASGGGGKGGDGGNGGSGAGGNGGHSYPLVFRGMAPVRSDVTYTPGQPGLRGGGGFVSGTSGAVHAPNGTDGVAAAEHEVP